MIDRPAPAALLLVVVALAGCIGAVDPGVETAPVTEPARNLSDPIDVSVTDALAFNASVVDPAVGIFHGLYEPTVEVSDSGTIYIAGHVNGVLTTGTPAYVSTDGGETWEPLPFAGSAQAPSPVQNSQPPNGDEGFIVAGEDGRAWMVDITLDRFPVTGWCDDGAEQCYWHPNAFDRAAATTSPATQGCNAVASLNDRPWAAYANGTLLMVNNPGTGQVQVGVMEVPRDGPVEVAPPEWNVCAADGDQIPGVPALRDDGRFVVPSVAGETLRAVTGNVDDVQDTEVHEVFGGLGGTAGADYGDPHNWGRAAFDAEGRLYMGALTGGDAAEQITFAISDDGGRNFTTRTVDVNASLGFFYLDGNPNGPGALATWTQAGNGSMTADFYAGHVMPGPGGAPVLEHVSLVADEVVNPRGDVYGASVGPDGRAHLAVYTYPGPHPLGERFGPGDAPGYPATAIDYAGSTPLSVAIQTGGPALPNATVAPIPAP